MNFVLMLFYIAFALLSPEILPEFLRDIHIIWILGFFSGLTTLVVFARSGLAKLPGTYFVFGILLAATLSIVGTGWVGGGVSTFIGFVPVVFTYYFIVAGCNKPSRLLILTYVLYAVMLFIVMQGMVAHLAGNFDSPYIMQEGFSNGQPLYRHRGLGVLSDPNDLAQALVTVLPMLWLRWKKGAVLGNVFLTLIPAATLIVGVYQTHSRGGIIALIAVMLYGFKDRLGLVKGTILAGLCTVGVFALNFTGGRDMNNDDGERVSLWGQALTAFRSHPLTGVGMYQFSNYSDLGLTAHNSYVLCLAEMGVIGYFFWMGAVVISWWGLTGMVAPQAKNKTVDDGDAVRKSFSKETFPLQIPTTGLYTADAFSGESSTAWMKLRPALEHTSRDMAADQRGAPLGSWTEEEDTYDDETLAYYGRILQAAFVGLLVTAFFLSRTYSMIFYIIFGMSGSLQAMYRRQHPEMTLNTGRLLKRVFLIIIVSIMGLYLFIRIRGVG